MADFLGMMKQAAELQAKMKAMQDELDHIEVEGIAGGGVRTNGRIAHKGDLVRPGGWKLLGGLLAIFGAIDAVLAPRLLRKSWEKQEQSAADHPGDGPTGSL